MAKYSSEQRQMIQLGLRLSRGMPPKVRKALLEAMAVESNFRNLNYGDRDSQGVLQQRPSTGWGPPGNATQDIKQFLQRAVRASQGFSGSAGELAQSVQRSAFPGRYDEREQEINALMGGQIGGGINAARGSNSSPATPRTAPPVDFMQEMLKQVRSKNPSYQQALLLSTANNQSNNKQAVEAPANPAPETNIPGSLMRQLQRLGLGNAVTSGERSVAENRATGGSPTSYHLPGGPSAYDLNPNDKAIPGLIKFAKRNPGYFKEFFGPVGWYIKNGKVIKGQFPGHEDHFHVAR